MRTLYWIDWLLSIAGPAAVSAPAVADALLRLGPQDGKLILLPELAFARGLQLSTQQIVAASRERVAGLDYWIEEAQRRAGGGSCNLVLQSILLGAFDDVSSVHAYNITLHGLAHVLFVSLIVRHLHMYSMHATDAAFEIEDPHPATAFCVGRPCFPWPEHLRQHHLHM
jgi:hypothetical protein